jgi:hypothetical protein
MANPLRRVLVVSASLLTASAWLAPAPARAFTPVTANNLSGLSSSSVNDLLQVVGVGADHHAYMPATALGMTLGIDIGVDVTYLSFPSAFTSALSTASGQSTASLPSGVPMPKINIHKGLPFGIDVGASFVTLSSGGSKVFSSYAGEAKYAIINSAALPTVAVRASYSSNEVYFIDAKTFTFDAVVSKNLMLIDPYVGLGIQHWSGSIEVPAGVPTPSGVDLSGSGTPFHMYAGTMLKLGFLKLVGEIDYSTIGLTTYGGKLSFGF